MFEIVLFEAYFLRRRSFICHLFVLYSDYFLLMHYFSVVLLCHTYTHYHPDNGSKSRNYGLKKRSYFSNKTYFRRLISNIKVTFMPILDLHIDYLSQTPSFSVFRFSDTHANSHPNSTSKRTH